jgi:hypothetical protein
MKSLVSSVALATIALSTAAYSEGMTNTANPVTSGQSAGNQQNSTSASQDNILSINKLKQDLQAAGFTNVRILADSFIVQATDKDGNPTVMTLSPSGVFAISELTNNSANRKASGTGSNSPSSGSSNTQRTR